MKKIFEIAFIGAAAYVSGRLYEEGRKSAKDTGKIDPKAWAGIVGSRLSRETLSKLIEEARRRVSEQQAAASRNAAAN